MFAEDDVANYEKECKKVEVSERAHNAYLMVAFCEQREDEREYKPDLPFAMIICVFCLSVTLVRWTVWNYGVSQVERHVRQHKCEEFCRENGKVEKQEGRQCSQRQ